LAICAGVRLEICVDARPGAAAGLVAPIVVPAICGAETEGGARAEFVARTVVPATCGVETVGGARAGFVARIVVPATCGVEAWDAKTSGVTLARGIAIVVEDVGCG